MFEKLLNLIEAYGKSMIIDSDMYMYYKEGGEEPDPNKPNEVLDGEDLN